MFVQGGFVNPGRNLRYAGHYGSYWSSVGLDSNYAYSLYLDPLGVTPSVNDRRYLGFSLRCVALGG